MHGIMKNVEKFMIYITFHDCLNTFDWFSTKATSTQVCRIINENWKFQVKNKILLNTQKTHVNFSQSFWKLQHFYKLYI
jgi:hypothetical protein